jgi:rubrerythrin
MSINLSRPRQFSQHDLARTIGIPNVDETIHAEEMARGEWQCPQCDLGYRGFSANNDAIECPLCHYAGGPVKR